MTPAAVYHAQEVVRLIGATRCDLSDEKRTQADIATALTAAGIPFAREHRFSPGDVVDFLVRESVAVEVKLKHARKKDVFRQLERYAAHETCQVLVLVTGLHMGLPREILGKPVYVASLGRAWL